MRQNKHVRHIVIRRDSPGNRPGSPEHRTRFSGASHRFSRESSLPDLRSRRHGCTCPENRPRSTASDPYAMTSLSRSSAARANLLILRVFCLPSPISRNAAPSLRRSRYSFTRYTARCWPCQTVPRLLRSAPAPSGTLFMALGKLTPGCTSAVFASNTSTGTQGVSAYYKCNAMVPWNARAIGLSQGFGVFPRCACADRSMGDTRLVLQRIDPRS